MISDSRLIGLVEAARTIRDMKCIKNLGLEDKISAHLGLKPPNIHSSLSDLPAAPNDL